MSRSIGRWGPDQNGPSAELPLLTHEFGETPVGRPEPAPLPEANGGQRPLPRRVPRSASAPPAQPGPVRPDLAGGRRSRTETQPRAEAQPRAGSVPLGSAGARTAAPGAETARPGPRTGDPRRDAGRTNVSRPGPVRTTAEPSTERDSLRHGVSPGVGLDHRRRGGSATAGRASTTSGAGPRTGRLRAAMAGAMAGAASGYASAEGGPGGSRRHGGGRSGPPWRPIALAAAVLLPLSMAAVACGQSLAAPSTARVTRANVSTTVTGTGALRAISEQNLGFTKGGKITEINVTVGQDVKAGAVLARIDDFAARADVTRAQAAMDREQAVLDKLTDSEEIDAADDDARGAEDVLQATETQSDQVDRANDKAVENASRAVNGALADMQEAQAAHEANEVRCRKSIGGDSRARPGEVRQPGGIAGELFVPAPVESAACDRARTSAAALAQAQEGFGKARAEERAARQKRNTDHAEQAVAIQNAKRAHTAAKHDAKNADTTRPHDIDAQRAEIEAARADLVVAQREVEDTALLAPVDGKVGAINGTVGEFLDGGSGTTPQSPGSRVSLPDVGSEVGDSDSKAERPALGSFIQLSDVHAFQVVVPFEEADASKIKRNQPVDLTFDSVPGLTRHGTVMSISPSGNSINDVTNYYATVLMNEGPNEEDLKDGQTVQANVLVGEIRNALVVPNSALQGGGQSGLVTVLEPDNTQRQVQVQLGARGDENTEVLSGLSDGQFVVIADA